MESFVGVAAAWVASSGLLLWFVKRWIERRLKKAEAQVDGRSQYRKERWALEDEYHKHLGRFLYWMMKGARAYEAENDKGFWNGELQEAFDRLTDAENRRKALDRQQLAELNEE